MPAQTIKLAGRRFVILPEKEYRKLRAGVSRKQAKGDGSKPKPFRDVPLARMTKQVRGDIAEANRIRKAIQEGREKLIPWEQVKRELGLT